MVGDPAELQPSQPVPAQGHPPAHVSERQAGPARQVPLRGRAVAPEVAARELAEGLVAIQSPRLPHPLLEQDEGLLLAAEGTQHERPGLGEIPEEVVGALAVDHDPARRDRGQQRLARRGLGPLRGAPTTASRARPRSSSR